MDEDTPPRRMSDWTKGAAVVLACLGGPALGGLLGYGVRAEAIGAGVFAWAFYPVLLAYALCVAAMVVWLRGR